MIYVMVKHHVKDYEKWRVHFDNQEEARQAVGLEVRDVFCSSDNQKEITILMRTEDVLATQLQMVGDKETAQIMKDAGVIGTPTLLFLDKVL